MTGITELIQLHKKSTPGVRDSQPFALLSKHEQETGMAMYVGGAWKEAELRSNASFMTEAHNQFPSILHRLGHLSEQAKKVLFVTDNKAFVVGMPEPTRYDSGVVVYGSASS